MTRHFGSRGGPPWWPANEGFPSRRGPFGSDAARRRFFRRLIVLFAGSLALIIAAVFGAAWLMVDRFGAPGWAAPLSAMVVLFAAVAMAARFTRSMRGFVRPLKSVMEAADRVAGGDYAVRVSSSGPPPMRALVRSFNTMAERLQDADRIRRNLMTDIAHELRTPVTILQGRLEGIIDGVYEADERHLAELVDETRVLSRLIEDVRTLALSDAGALPLDKEPVDIAALVRDIVRSMQAAADRASVSISVTAPTDAGSVNADPVRLREVLTNLLSNSLRHTPPGQTVSVSIEGRADCVALSVADTGEGIPQDQVAHIFDRFYKGSQSRGSGLGLAIAKSIVTAHGGAIEASSQPGFGTVITFSISR